MKKIYLLILILPFINALAKAQSGKGIALSIGPEFSIPFNTNSYYYGQTRDYYQDGIGGSAKIDVPITLTLHFTGSAGFVDYPTNQHYSYSPVLYLNINSASPAAAVQPPPSKFIPLKAGLQYYYDKYLYISGEAGEAIKGNSASLTSFIYSGGLGALIPFNAHNSLDIGARYERGYKIYYDPSAMSQASLRLAYQYKF